MVTVDVEELYKHEKKKEERPLTKIVMRRLPTSMTLETFLDQVSPIPEHNYFNFIKANDASLGMDNYSRSYLNFTNPADITSFKQKFDDYVFLDSKGREFPAVVEFAPYQRIKQKPHKKDPKSGTIEDDPYFREFKEQLQLEIENKKNVQPLNQYYFNMNTKDNEEEVTSTPLLEFVRNRRLEWLKKKEERREERRKKELERKKMKEDLRKMKLEQAAKMKAEYEKKRLSSITEGKTSKKITLTSFKRSKVTKPEVKAKDVTSVKEKKSTDVTEKNVEYPLSTSKIRLQSDLENKCKIENINKVETKVIEVQNTTETEVEKGISDKETVKIFDDNHKDKRPDHEQETAKTTTERGNKELESEHLEKLKLSDEDGDREKIPESQDKVMDRKEVKSSEREQQTSTEKNEEKDKSDERKDPRAERRLKNKDRPTIQIYRPGMGKFSRQRLMNNNE